MNKEEKDIHQLAIQRFKRCMDAEADNRVDWLEDLEFHEGEQWPEQIKSARDADNLPCLTINKVPQFVRQVVNDIRQIRPSLKVRGANSQATADTAEMMNGMIRAIEQDCDAESAYDWAAEHAVKIGVGYWRVLTDYESEDSFDQVIKIKRIKNPFSVYLDPAAEEQNGSDAKYGFVVTTMTKTEFENKYPGKKSGWEGGTGDEREWFMDDMVRVAEYWCMKEEAGTLYMIMDPMTGGQIVVNQKPPPLVDPITGEETEIPIIAQRDVMRPNITQYILSGHDVLETKPWAGDYIPIVRVFGRESDIEGETHVRGMVRDMKDPARQYNYFRSVSVERVGLISRAPWVGPEGSFTNRKWASANKKNHAYLEYKVVDPGHKPFRNPPPDISPGFANEVQVASQEFKEVTGIYNAGLGDRSNEVAGIAIDARKLESDVSNFDFVDNLSKAIRYSGKILVDLIPKIYSGPRLVRILQVNGEEETVQLNAPYVDQNTQKPRRYMLTEGRYDVAVDIGPSYTTQRQEAAESMIEILKAFPQAAPYIGDILARNMDWPEADEVAKRLKLTLPPEILADENPAIRQMMQQKDAQIEQMTQQGQMLMAQIQQLVEQLQDKDRELSTKEAEVRRKAAADLMSHTEGMTKLELDANRDLNQAGVAYE